METENNNTVNEALSEEIVFDSSDIEIHSWDELEINANILRGIFAYGFEKPSPIQQRAIKPVMQGRDVIAQAQSGTGKTATFTIGALQRVNIAEPTHIKTFVLSPANLFLDSLSHPTRVPHIVAINIFKSIGVIFNNSFIKYLLNITFLFIKKGKIIKIIIFPF